MSQWIKCVTHDYEEDCGWLSTAKFNNKMSRI